jgi:hypothetical protein
MGRRNSISPRNQHKATVAAPPAQSVHPRAAELASKVSAAPAQSGIPRTTAAQAAKKRSAEQPSPPPTPTPARPGAGSPTELDTVKLSSTERRARVERWLSKRRRMNERRVYVPRSASFSGASASSSADSDKAGAAVPAMQAAAAAQPAPCPQPAALAICQSLMTDSAMTAESDGANPAEAELSTVSTALAATMDLSVSGAEGGALPPMELCSDDLAAWLSTSS